MTTVVTATSGHLGRLIVEALLARGVPAGQVVATARDTTKIADLARRGVRTARADYSDPASLREAFTGADALVLVSLNEVGSGAGQDPDAIFNAIEAAAAAGVGLIAYTSYLHADTSAAIMAGEYRRAEEALVASGVPSVILRNGPYAENYTNQLPVYLEHGIVGAAGHARISAASRVDYAEAAAVVVTTGGHAGKVYELGGQAFTMAGLAQVVSAESGREVAYTDLPEQAYAEVLVGAGLAPATAQALADSHVQAAAGGEMHVEVDDLETLLGRRPTPLVDLVRAALV